MSMIQFPVIDPVATGANICRLRKDRGLTVRDLQHYFGFEEPQAIYKWQRGQSLPSVDNLYALSALLQVPMNEISSPLLISSLSSSRQPSAAQVSLSENFFRCSGHGRTSKPLRPLSACPSSVLQWPNQATALPQVSKRLEKRFSHHYYVYQGSVRLNSAFKGKRVEEMAAMR